MRILHKIRIVAGSALLRTRPRAIFPHVEWSTRPGHYQHSQLSSAPTTNINISTLRQSCLLATSTCPDSDVDPDTPTTLLIGSQQDAASCVMISALLAKGNWLEVCPGQEPDHEQQHGKAWQHAKSPVSLWSVGVKLLDLDDADRRWMELDSVAELVENRRRWVGNPSDVVLLSKHVARSGVPALCVHPIGLPDVSTYEALCLHNY